MSKVKYNGTYDEKLAVYLLDLINSLDTKCKGSFYVDYIGLRFMPYAKPHLGDKRLLTIAITSDKLHNFEVIDHKYFSIEYNQFDIIHKALKKFMKETGLIRDKDLSINYLSNNIYIHWERFEEKDLNFIDNLLNKKLNNLESRNKFEQEILKIKHLKRKNDIKENLFKFSVQEISKQTAEKEMTRDEFNLYLGELIEQLEILNNHSDFLHSSLEEEGFDVYLIHDIMDVLKFLYYYRQSEFKSI